MRNLILSVATGAAMTVGGFAAQAMPASPALFAGDAPAVTLVAEGCGPGFHRNFRGFCRPNFFGPRYGFGGYGFRRCFIRPGFYGPRRVCRF